MRHALLCLLVLGCAVDPMPGPVSLDAGRDTAFSERPGHCGECQLDEDDCWIQQDPETNEPAGFCAVHWVLADELEDPESCVAYDPLSCHQARRVRD